MHCVGVMDIPLVEWYCNECAQVVRDLNDGESPMLDPVENENLRAYLEDPEVIANFSQA